MSDQPPRAPGSIPAPATVPRPLSSPPPGPTTERSSNAPPAGEDAEPLARKRLDTLNPPTSVPPPATEHPHSSDRPSAPVVVPAPRFGAVDVPTPARLPQDLDGTTADYDPSAFEDAPAGPGVGGYATYFDDAPTADYDPRARGVFHTSGSSPPGPRSSPPSAPPPPSPPPSTPRPTPPPAAPDLDLSARESAPAESGNERPAEVVVPPHPPSSQGRARRRTSRRTVRIPNDPITRAPTPVAIETAQVRELIRSEEALAGLAHAPAQEHQAAAPALADLSDEIEHEAETVIKPMRILSIGEASPPPPSSPEDITDDIEAVLATDAVEGLGMDRESFSEIEEIEPDRMSDAPEMPKRAPPPPPKNRPDPSRVAHLPPPASHATPPPVTPPAATPPPVTPPPVTAPQDLERPRAKSWWEELFTDDFIRTLDRQERRHVAREVNFIEESLGVQQGAVILDLACGSGEHAVELASRGYSVVGYDLSLAMLARAADEAQERNQKINFLQGDMREMAFEEMFDGIYCWSTSFGYFDDERNYSVLQRIHRALRVGGMFLLDMVNRDYAAPRSPSLVWYEGDGCVCMDDMHVDFFTSRLRVKRTTMLDDGRSKELDYSIRLYALHELGKMLHECGFKVVEVTGHPAHPGIFFGSESPRMIVLAEKSG
jgi:SAM-dependent methyltransferase